LHLHSLCGATLFGSHQAIYLIPFAKFGWVKTWVAASLPSVACATLGSEAEHRIHGGCAKTLVLF